MWYLASFPGRLLLCFLVAYVTFEPPSDKLPAYLTRVQRSHISDKGSKVTYVNKNEAADSLGTRLCGIQINICLPALAFPGHGQGRRRFPSFHDPGTLMVILYPDY